MLQVFGSVTSVTSCPGLEQRYLHISSRIQIFPAIFSDKLRLGDPRVESAISQRPVLASQRPYRGNRRRVCLGFVCGLFTVCVRPWSPILFLLSIPSLTFLRFGSALLAQQFFFFIHIFPLWKSQWLMHCFQIDVQSKFFLYRVAKLE